jgi:hypothetical protein
MATHAVYRLLPLPFRLVRGLFRYKATPARLNASYLAAGTVHAGEIDDLPASP